MKQPLPTASFSPSTIIVAGFGRCGTSMLMQMLAAGGVPCLGRAPAFEDPRTQHVPPPFFWERDANGKAVKLLDPQRLGSQALPLVDAPARIIWLNRNPVEQAKSHAKFLRVMTGVSYTREQRRQLERNLLADRSVVRRLLAGRRVLIMWFESVLKSPQGAAQEIAQFIDHPFNAGPAAQQVRQRGAACLPDLSLELDLIQAMS